MHQALLDEAVTITLGDELDISRGDVIVHQEDKSIMMSDKLETMLVWMDNNDAIINQVYQLKLASTTVNAKITNIGNL